MGNKPSSLSKGGRVLAQKSANAQKYPKPQSTRLSAHEKGNQGQTEADNSDIAVAQRLQKLGQVQFKPMEENYKPASEDKFTMTLEARQRIEDENSADLEKGGLRKLLPASTITAILESIRDGDSAERINKAYSLDPSVLPKLQNLSLPKTVAQQDVANQLLKNANSERQPVRRKRKQTTN